MSGELDLMLQSLNSMRVEGLLTDVILVTSSGLEIPAHKNILAARSRYFYCMFNGGMYFNLFEEARGCERSEHPSALSLQNPNPRARPHNLC